MYQYTHDHSEVEVEGRTVGECLNQLVILFPEVSKMLFGTDGKFLNYFHISLNGEIISPESFDRPVRNMDVLELIPIFTGG